MPNIFLSIKMLSSSTPCTYLQHIIIQTSTLILFADQTVYIIFSPKLQTGTCLLTIPCFADISWYHDFVGHFKHPIFIMLLIILIKNLSKLFQNYSRSYLRQSS